MANEISRVKRTRLRYGTGPEPFEQTARPSGVDDPDSPEYVPLELRSEMEKARFFHRAQKRQARHSTTGVFDG